MDVYLDGNRLQLNPSDAIAKGGEADIFKLANGLALKLFKQPNHPDLAGMVNEQEAARFRLKEHQTKLLAIPKGLPNNVTVPIDIAYTQQKNKQYVAGYSMKFVDGANTLLAYSDMNFKKSIPFNVLVSVLRNLRKAFIGIHNGGVVLGDANDLNILVVGDQVHIIDIDSSQFGQYYCYVFTQRFLDPLVASFNNDGLSLGKPYVPTSDWYAFSVMVMQTLLSAGPYSGITDLKNKDGKRIKYHERVADRITVFDSRVRYPRNAVPYGSLPDDLNNYLFKVFVKNEREEFPEKLLDMTWQKCGTCGMWHARSQCPSCAQTAPAAVVQKVQIRGKVMSTRIFQTRGHILFASINSGKLEYLYHEDGVFKREFGNIGWKGDPEPTDRYRISGKRTLMGRKDSLVIHNPLSQTDQKLPVDSSGNLALFDANNEHFFWAKSGNLMRDHLFGSEHLGQVMTNQTLFWVGNKRGFGFYSAGEIRVAFVFNPNGKGIKDSILPPYYTGQLIDSTCVFSYDGIWFMYSVQEAGTIKNRCLVYDSQGNAIAADVATQGDDTWLGNIRGKTALGNRLLSITPDGIVRLKHHNNSILIEAEYPDTEPFVHSGCHLFINPDGLYVVDNREIRLLKIT